MKYPNLELIEKTFKEKVKEKYPSIFDISNQWHKCTADVFVQTWGSTATGFDLEPVCSGQAFTDEYTTAYSAKNKYMEFSLAINLHTFLEAPIKNLNLISETDK